MKKILRPRVGLKFQSETSAGIYFPRRCVTDFDERWWILDRNWLTMRSRGVRVIWRHYGRTMSPAACLRKDLHSFREPLPDIFDGRFILMPYVALFSFMVQPPKL